jgi:hypothetical protein
MADRKPDLALQQFEKAATLDPDNPSIKTQIGVSELGVGQGEQGLVTLEQVFGTEAGTPIAGPALVIAELRARRLDKAAEVASSLLQRDAKNPVYHTLLGEVRATQRDYSAHAAARGRRRRFPAPGREAADCRGPTQNKAGRVVFLSIVGVRSIEGSGRRPRPPPQREP